MSKPILYLGDTSLTSAASYLAGVLSHAGWEFDYLPSDTNLKAEDIAGTGKLIIFSDYPAERVDASLQNKIVEQVRQGTALMMIGGWESFQGSGGNWAGTAIGNLLPVVISEKDDRKNCDQPVFIRCPLQHPITDGLPWNERPPLIGGYNQVKAKPEGTVLLEAERYHASFRDGEATCELVRAGSDPLLVIDDSQPGRIAALMTDLAPHWVGPLVDWGEGRVTSRCEVAEEIEVGNLYTKLIKQLIEWVGQLNR